MDQIRITKYDPQYRDERGAYLKDEWTSITDIEARNYLNVTFADYLIVEMRYVKAVQTLMTELDVSELTLVAVEKNAFSPTSVDGPLEKEMWENLSENMIIPKQNIEIVVRLILREKLWGKLISNDLSIHFGYDYYMYALGNKSLKKGIAEIEASGLFVDFEASPYQ